MPDNFDLYGLMEEELEVFDQLDPQRALVELEDLPIPVDAWLLEADFDD